MAKEALTTKSVLRPQHVFGRAHDVRGQAVFADGASKTDTVRIVLKGIMQGIGHWLG